ncbi:MAG: hypothetical protein ACREDA_12795, partial [Methylocella sp.]
MLTDEPFNPAAACLMPPGAQSCDPGRSWPKVPAGNACWNGQRRGAIPAAMRRMDPPDLPQQSGIGRPARAIRPIAPGVIQGRRDPQHIAHGANGETIALILDAAEFHRGAFEKMRSDFFYNLPLHAQALIGAPQT